MFGVAANTEYFNDKYLERLEEFNTIVAENGCKMLHIHPQRDVYNFTDCDAHLAKAEELGMQFRGHTLLWGGFQPMWFYGTKGEDMRAAIVDHITTILNHYKGKVKIWDVVNEAIDDQATGENGTWQYRDFNIYREVPDFVDLAFTTARSVDPEVKLFYNDYDIEGVDIHGGKKTDAVYNFLKDLKERGIPVDGVGFQYHMHTNEGFIASYESIMEAMARFGELGLEVQITEADVDCVGGASEENYALQAKSYADGLRACLDSPNCTGYLIWGIDDPDSWRYEGVPLIFDGNFDKKPAYYSLLNVFLEHNNNKEDSASDEDIEVESGDVNGVEEEEDSSEDEN
ncbi:glycoside hydrolase family 10 protein [Piromyces sp. E2]|nr:glycoside hydrolase family 10 protein [Piromyces sp. E2]|eukprot:OUM63391.1 glycoside hydrolase family 10 protein [Piromyces sp. E2]